MTIKINAQDSKAHAVAIGSRLAFVRFLHPAPASGIGAMSQWALSGLI